MREKQSYRESGVEGDGQKTGTPAFIHVESGGTMIESAVWNLSPWRYFLLAPERALVPAVGLEPAAAGALDSVPR